MTQIIFILLCCLGMLACSSEQRIQDNRLRSSDTLIDTPPADSVDGDKPDTLVDNR